LLEINKIYNIDCLDGFKLLSDESIDLVFTDPPYLKKYLYCYDYLANECPRIMKYGASLLTIVGHYALEEVMYKFKGKLKYRWILCMNQFNGKHARMAMGIEVMWKPILWYVKGAYPMGRGFLRDGIEITGTAGQEKKLHIWEQDLSWALYYIEKLTKPGDLVLDPFMGSGTVAVACRMLNRNFIGFEINEDYCDIAERRIKNISKTEKNEEKQRNKEIIFG
jgi:DNA modification methylase